MHTYERYWMSGSGPDPRKGLFQAPIASMILYAISFFLPFDREYGYTAFLAALWFCCWCPLMSPWLANPLYWIALVAAFCGRPGTAAVWGILASIFALLGILYVERPEPAYVVWLVSIGILPLAAFVAASVQDAKDIRTPLHETDEQIEP